MMAPKASSTLFLLLTFLFIALSAASDITQVLSGFPDFSAFSNLLTQTKLVDEINKQGTVTVLAVDASALAATKGLSPDVLKRVLSVHVILDYYDADKLQNMAQDSITLTTLYQTSGTADQKQGFVNLSKIHNALKFGSAVPGASQDSEIIKVVVNKPSTLSVLQVSSVIVPPGIDKVSPPTTTTPPPAQAHVHSTPPVQSPPPAAQSSPPAKAAAPSPAAQSLPPTQSSATAKMTAPVPAPSSKSNANAPAAAVATHVSSPADAPSGDADEDTSPAVTPQASSPESESPEAESPQAYSPKKAESPEAESPHADSPEAESPQAESPKADSPVATSPAASPSIASSPAASGPGTNKDEVADAPMSGTRRAAASTAGIELGILGAILLGL